MAAPWFKIRHLEESAGLVGLSANFVLYGDMSDRMMTLAAGLGPTQEIYSIDESFIGLQPGGDPEPLRPGDEIAYTQPAIDLIQLVGKYMFGGGAGAGAPPPPPPPPQDEATPSPSEAMQP